MKIETLLPPHLFGPHPIFILNRKTNSAEEEEEEDRWLFFYHIKI